MTRHGAWSGAVALRHAMAHGAVLLPCGMPCGALALLHIYPLLSLSGVLARNPRGGGILHKILPANHSFSYKLR